LAGAASGGGNARAADGLDGFDAVFAGSALAGGGATADVPGLAVSVLAGGGMVEGVCCAFSAAGGGELATAAALGFPAKPLPTAIQPLKAPSETAATLQTIHVDERIT
jgi:hypothetical protein